MLEANLSRRGFLRMVGGTAAAMMIGGCGEETARAGGKAGLERKKPNIIFILADDMGYGDLRCLNPESKIPTPNMDRIAKEGMRFTDAHSGSAVCTPTRYGVLTGRYCWRSRLKRGVLGGYSSPLLEPGRPTVASFLRENGYETACVGKWHLGLGWQRTDKGKKILYDKPLTDTPVTHGFDYSYIIPASLDMAPYVYIENDRVTELPTEHAKASGRPKFWRAGPKAPGFEFEEVLPTLTDKAIGFIKRHKKEKGDSPFFLYFALTAPHTPWVPKNEFKGKSKAGIYGDFVVEVDWTIGQILKTLDELNLKDDTLVIVTSDNGSHWLPEWIKEFDHRANYIYRGMKSDIWDGGHHVPFIARWPKVIKAGSVSNELTCLTDLFATCADIVGKPLPANAAEDSFSILDAMKGGKGKREAAVIHHSISGMFAIRKGRWKMVLGKGSGGWSSPKTPKGGIVDPAKTVDVEGQLYDMVNDPEEKVNLFDKRPEVVRELKGLLEKYAKDGHSRVM